MRYLVIDTETGGLDPKINPVMQIGMILYLEDGTVDMSFERRPLWNPRDKKIRVGAINVNQMRPLTIELTDGPFAPPLLTATDLVGFLAAVANRGEVALVGQNLQFDTDFIESFLNDQGYYDWLEGFQYTRRIDIGMLAFYLQQICLLPKQIKIGLNGLHQHFFGTSVPEHHTALGDVKATWAVFQELLRLGRERVTWDPLAKSV